MIEITKGWSYEDNGCDCCEGWYNKIYTLSVDGVDHGDFTDLETLFRTLEGIASDKFQYWDSEYPAND